MRRLLGLARSSIAGRLITLALAPALLMLVVVNVALYVWSIQDATADVQDKAQVVADSLAEGSRYAVVSGNTAGIEQTISGLFAADASVMRVEVLDARRRPQFVRQRSTLLEDVVDVEAPISAQSLDVDLFDNAPTRHARPAGTPVGFVRVTVSPTPIVAKRVPRLAVGGSLVLLAGLASFALGLALERRLREPLVGVLEAIRSVRAGRFDVPAHRDAPGELGELQRSVQAMTRDLRLTQERMDAEVQARTVALREALDRLQASDGEKRRLIASSNAMVEAERRRISREIHDDLNAALVSLRFHVAALDASLRRSGDAEAAQEARRALTLIDHTYARARDIVRHLRPEILDALGLAGAAEEKVRHLDELQSGCRYMFERVGTLPALDEETAIAAYRILQEALTNVLKHARATRCKVSLGTLDGGRSIQLVITDNGVGIDADPNDQGLGLVGMRERVAALNGTLTILSTPGQGTTLEVVIPVVEHVV